MIRITKNHQIQDDLNRLRLNIVDYGHAVADTAWKSHPINPPYARLYYILDGDPCYTTPDGRTVPLPIGHCLLFPTGYSFSHACATSVEQLFFHINLFDRYGTDLLRKCPTPMEYAPAPEEIRRLQRLSEQSDPCCVLHLRQLLYGSLLTLFDRYAFKPQTERYSACVRDALLYIGAHATEHPTVAEIAAHCFVSERTLSGKFRAEVGISVGAHMENAVLEQALGLLCSTELSLQAISERCGFCDQFYFSRRFKARYGLPPQKYRLQRPV